MNEEKEHKNEKESHKRISLNKKKLCKWSRGVWLNLEVARFDLKNARFDSEGVKHD